MAILGSRLTDKPDVRSEVEALKRDGITALKGAFTREWAEQMRET